MRMAGIARRRMGAEMDQQAQAYEAQQRQLKDNQAAKGKSELYNNRSRNKLNHNHHMKISLTSCKNMLNLRKKDYYRKKNLVNSRWTYCQSFRL